jgi:hypothetical protein
MAIAYVLETATDEEINFPQRHKGRKALHQLNFLRVLSAFVGNKIEMENSAYHSLHRERYTVFNLPLRRDK